MHSVAPLLSGLSNQQQQHFEPFRLTDRISISALAWLSRDVNSVCVCKVSVCFSRPADHCSQFSQFGRTDSSQVSPDTILSGLSRLNLPVGDNSL